MSTPGYVATLAKLVELELLTAGWQETTNFWRVFLLVDMRKRGRLKASGRCGDIAGDVAQTLYNEVLLIQKFWSQGHSFALFAIAACGGQGF